MSNDFKNMPLKTAGNIAVIFAGGHGERFGNSDIPKQFHELSGKPVIVYTLEHFERHDKIDGIVVVCVDSWISRLKRMLEEFRISKVVEIVPGGATAWDSIFAGLGCATKYFSGETVVLIHDAVRPMIDSGTIDRNIETVKRYGSCITCYPMTENIMGNSPNGMTAISDPGELLIVRAPQSFFLNKIMAVYEKARQEGNVPFRDCCSMMSHYGEQLRTVTGPAENIKITFPSDFLMFENMRKVTDL